MMRRPIGVSICGYGYVLFSMLTMLALVVALAVIYRHPPELRFLPEGWRIEVLSAIPIFVALVPAGLFLQLLYVVTGIGMLKGQRWSRRAGLVLAAASPIASPLAWPMGGVAYLILLQPSIRDYFHAQDRGRERALDVDQQARVSPHPRA